MIVADTREKISHPFEDAELPCGDYVVDTNDDHPGYLVERKSYVDFVGSVRTGKMYTQIRMIQEQDYIPVLLLEGSRRPAIRHANSTAKEIRRAVTSILVKSDIRMVHASSPEESVKVIQDLEDWVGGDSGTHAVRETEKVSDDDRPRYIVEGLPGVGPKTALALLDHFDTARAVLTATEDDLQDVPGIGPKTAKKIIGSVTR